MELFSSAEIGFLIGRGRHTVNVIADRLGIEPLRMMGNRRVINATQTAAILQAFNERKVFFKSGRPKISQHD